MVRGQAHGPGELIGEEESRTAGQVPPEHSRTEEKHDEQENCAASPNHGNGTPEARGPRFFRREWGLGHERLKLNPLG